MSNKNKRNYYLNVNSKFIISLVIALLWTIFCILISVNWIIDIANLTNLALSLIIITCIAYIPGYLNIFLVVSLLLDRQKSLLDNDADDDVTIVIPAYNEEKNIYNTLSYISKQTYKGKISILVVDNNSSDNTISEVKRAKVDMGLDITIIKEKKQGKFNALNNALSNTNTQYLISLDADTIILPRSIHALVTRIKYSPEDICAVAGCMLVRNSRENLLTKMQDWDYFFSISVIKRMQGLYQGVLVAQGAFSIYKTDVLKSLGGWSDAIGEDIVLTWKMFSKGYKVYYEPLAIAHTLVPTTFKHFARQRSRWARGMIEAIKEVKPWSTPRNFSKYLTGIDLIIPYLDLAFTFFWIPGLILAFWGYYYIVGIMTLFVLPLSLLTFYIEYRFKINYVFKELNLKLRNNKLGFVLFVFIYQIISSPISILGYIQEFLKLNRKWK
jgi:poly-beta-1,6-N-acetyl-D-glucosamine synthase